MVCKIKRFLLDQPLKRLMILTIVAGLLVSVFFFFTVHLTIRPYRDYKMTAEQKFYYDNVMYIVLFLLMLGGIIAAVTLFFRIKMNKPLRLLQLGTQKIEEDDLDFHLEYPAGDEFGSLIAGFEKMRKALEHSSRSAWKMAEERRQVNAAFAHDLRTPLTVLKGQLDLLEVLLPTGDYDPEKVLDAVRKMSVHVEHMHQYVTMMNEIQRLENTPVQPVQNPLKPLLKDMEEYMKELALEYPMEFSIQGGFEKEAAVYDYEVILRAVENVLRNAFCCGYHQVTLKAESSREYLRFTVEDDGPGFMPKQLAEGPVPFAKGKSSTGCGMGLAICRTLCRNHGGDLEMYNRKQGGAGVALTFSVKSDFYIS